jgi:hypothetical protein
MGSSRWFGRILVVVALLAPPLVVAPVARATVMVPIPLEDMVRDASAIVHARVIRSGSRLALEDGGRPHTLTQLEVIEWLSGTGGAQITIDEIGGSHPAGDLVITGTPVYRAGDEVVVFLRSTTSVEGAAYRTMGMIQGQFVVRHGVPGVNDTVVRDTSDIGLATWDGGPMSVVEGGREVMQLEAFLAWIRDTVEQLRLPGASGATAGER